MSEAPNVSHLSETFVFKERYEVKWYRLGNTSHPPVILVHGFPFSSLEWLQIARALSKHYSVYLFDFPGFGASSKSGAVSLAEHGEIFAALYEYWGFDETLRPHVIAHDIGGHAVFRSHLIHNTKFASLCLINVLAVTPWGSPFLRAVMKTPEAFTAIPLPLFNGLMREYIQIAAWNKLTEAKMNTFIEPWADVEGQKRFIDQVSLFDQKHTEEMEEHFSSIMIHDGSEPKKLKIIWAGEDALIPLRKGEALEKVTGAAEFVKVPKAGHLIMLDEPELVTYEIVDWLRKTL